MILLLQIVAIDLGGEPLIVRRGAEFYNGGAIGPAVALCGGKPDRGGFVEVRGRWRVEFERDTINAVAWGPDFVASAGADGVVAVLDAESGAVRHRLEGHAAAVLCVAVAPDGLIATGGRDRTIRLWRDGALARTIQNHADAVNALDFSPDGARLASASSDHSVRLWQPDHGRLVRIVRTGAEALSLAYGSDGTWLAAGCADGAVKIVDASTGIVTRDLKPFDDAVTALAAGETVLAAAWGGDPVEITPDR